MRFFAILFFGFLVSVSASNAHNYAPHWGYSGDGSPEHWGELADEFHACKYGKNQSPIDITQTTKSTLQKPIFDYKNNPKELINNGHTLQVNFNPGSTIAFQNKKFELLQIHFHTPSEYTFNKKHYPMVAHLVHKASDGELLVLAIMFDKGDENPVIKQIWSPIKAGESKKLANLAISDLVKNLQSYIKLDGSLTTPPCSEGVIWLINKDNAFASDEQIKFFTNIIGQNNRPTQAINGRKILEISK
ncbi:carbonic anhydrase family protein [Campylobacter sp. CX2-4080-23]|uniref:carbonic anhydrase n=1 Tax=Campylobacter porcelli TaxID=1660073 RepID=UPI002ECC2641|nr:carbonic anhydrase family protein [Campylobacter sp. CX2-4080-23]